MNLAIAFGIIVYISWILLSLYGLFVHGYIYHLDKKYSAVWTWRATTLSGGPYWVYKALKYHWSYK